MIATNLLFVVMSFVSLCRRQR